MNNMPTITKNLLIINILMFAGRYVASLYGIDLDNLLGLHFFLASDFRWYQFFTYMFMHGGLEHLFLNLFALWMFGRIIENKMGFQQFLFYYITCGLGAGITQECTQYINYLIQYDHLVDTGSILEMSDYLNNWTTVGASGAVYGILLAFGMSYPNERIFIIAPNSLPERLSLILSFITFYELYQVVANFKYGFVYFAPYLAQAIFFLGFILRKRDLIYTSVAINLILALDGINRGLGISYVASLLTWALITLLLVQKPLKSKYFVGLYALAEFFAALTCRGDGIAHFAHLGGMLFGLLLILYWRNHGGGRSGSGYGGYSYYDRDSGSNGWRQWFSGIFRRQKSSHTTQRNGGKYTQDMNYRQQQKEHEEEIDHILDKVKRNGYNGLTEEEKKRLFDFSQKK